MRKGVIYLLFAIIVVVCLIVFVSVGLILESFQGTENVQKTETITVVDGQANTIPFCGDELQLLDRFPVNINTISHVTPLGSVDPPKRVIPSRYIYFNLKTTENDSTALSFVDVVATSHMWITRIESHTLLEDTTYKIYAQPCDEVTIVFSEIVALDESINVLPDNSIECDIHETGKGILEICSFDTFIELLSGTRIGLIGGSSDSTNFGLSIHDARFDTITYANPFRFDFSQYGEPSCPLHYFDSDLRLIIENVTGYIDDDELVQVDPVCGNISFDEVGSIAGNWFREGISAFPEERHISLFDDTTTLDKGIFSLGHSFSNIPPGIYSFEIGSEFENINTRFSLAKRGETYCYEVTNSEEDFVLLLELIRDHMLHVEVLDVTKCNSNLKFSSDYNVFIR